MKPEPFWPCIVVDSREKAPLPFLRAPWVTGCLRSGDYSFVGGEELFSVERKSIPDLVASVTGERARFERELHRLRGFRFSRLLIVGTETDISEHRYQSKANPKSILHSLRAFEMRYNVAVAFVPDADLAGGLVEGWAYWFAREFLKTADAIRKGVPDKPPIALI